MSDDPSQRNNGGGSRDDARKEYSTPMRFESAGGVVVVGQTRDVSPSGAFLALAEDVSGRIAVGEEGAAFLEMKKGADRFEVSFPCVVARVVEGGIALNFEEEEEDGDGDGEA